MKYDKSYCEVHHFYYSGNQCPLCQKEKYDTMYKSHIKHTISSPKNKDLTENDIKKLSDKFKVIRK